MPSYRRLQQFAVIISILSIFYNGAEGGVSIGFGAESASRSLVFFGVQSGIEVISSILVVWRFRHIAKPGEERGLILNPRDLHFEKVSSTGIAFLLMALGLSTEITAIVSLTRHETPDSSNASIIISASALVLMIIIWLPKNYLARALNSCAIQGEAQCSLSCIQMTIVLFAGSLIYRLWKGGWWVDAATSILLGLMFAWEGIKMLRWARDPDFDGGCCKHDKKLGQTNPPNDAELIEAYRDLCSCCSEKEECREADVCKCESRESEVTPCCKPVSSEGAQCCTRQLVQGKNPKPNTASKQPVELGNVIDKPAGSCCGSPSATPAIKSSCDCCA